MTTRRSAGQRLRIEAKRRRHEVTRRFWKSILLTIVGWLAIATIGTSIMAQFNADMAWFLAGVFFGIGVFLPVVFFRFLDYRGAQLSSGADAEFNTADQLRKLRRQGWYAIHNIHLDGDIDHVAIGPAGVFAIETKSANADWAFIESVGKPSEWSKQARRSATRTRHLVKQHAGHLVDVRPLVVAWVPEQPDDYRTIAPDVICIRGRSLTAHLRSLPTVLEPLLIQEIAVGLEAAAAQLDEHVGVTYPGRLKRLFGLET